MSSVETVKERHGYLWWIMVASTWFKRRIHQSNSEIKKSTARNWTIWSKVGVVSNMYFKRKKSWKQLLWLLANESTEGKTKVKCWLGCTETAKKLREWKMPWNPNHMLFTLRHATNWKWKNIKSAQAWTGPSFYIRPSRIFDITKPLLPLSHTSVPQFSYRTFART